MSEEKTSMPFGELEFLIYGMHSIEDYKQLASQKFEYQQQQQKQQQQEEEEAAADELKLKQNAPVEESNSVIDYSKLTSFLEVDNSFLTPWNWNTNAQDNGGSSSEGKKYMHFEPGSFFANKVCFVRPEAQLVSEDEVIGGSIERKASNFGCDSTDVIEDKMDDPREIVGSLEKIDA